MHLKLKLWGHTGSGALTWRRTLSLHIQPQQKLGNTHTECTTRTRNIAMWPGCTWVSVLFVHLPPKHVTDKSWAKEMNKHSKSYSGLWSKAQGSQEKSSRANHMWYPQLQCICSSVTRKYQRGLFSLFGGRSTSTMFQLLEPHASCPSYSVTFLNGLKYSKKKVAQIFIFFQRLSYRHESVSLQSCSMKQIKLTCFPQQNKREKKKICISKQYKIQRSVLVMSNKATFSEKTLYLSFFFFPKEALKCFRHI